jgi:multiple sugar transport system substrate-binding protein
MKKACPVLIFGIALAVAAGAGGKRDAPVPVSEGGPVMVSCYDSVWRDFLEEAAALFREQGGGRIEVQTFSAMPEIRSSDSGNTRTNLVQIRNDPQGRSAYINRVNTALMAGEGADIYGMDILPIHLYAEGGLLENLDNFMAADPLWNDGSFRLNILQAARYRGGLWFLPVDYSFGYYAYDRSLIPPSADFGTGKSLNIGMLTDMAGPLFSGGAKVFNLYDHVPGSLGGLFKELLDEQYYYFVDQEGRRANFNDGVFAGLLETVRNYAETGFILQSAAGTAEGMDPAARETERYFFKINSNAALVNQYGRLSGRRMMIRTPGSSGGIEDDDEIAGIRANRDGSVPFNFSQAYGINANARNKQGAWEFLKFLLSEEIQGSAALSFTTLPLNNRARAAKAERVFSGAYMGQGQALNQRQRELLGAYQTAVEELSDQINRYVVRDTLIDDMIASETRYFFDRSRTAEAVAAVLHNKVNLYLNER